MPAGTDLGVTGACMGNGASQLYFAAPSPLETRPAATRNPARWRGWKRILGGPKLGKRTDGALLNAAPLLDIAKLGRICTPIGMQRMPMAPKASNSCLKTSFKLIPSKVHAPPMFSSLIEKIEAHESYGPAMRQAASEGSALVLNYHRHQGNDRFCVSICTVELSPIKLLVSEEENALTELVHIEGVAESEEDYAPLCVAFSNALCAHYGLPASLELYFNGEPRPA